KLSLGAEEISGRIAFIYGRDHVRLEVQMSLEKEVIRGQAISASDLNSIPDEDRLYWTDELPHLSKFEVFSDQDRSELEDEIDRRKSNVTYQCPEGSDITERVVSACASGVAGVVVVECAHKTWARYPCQI